MLTKTGPNNAFPLRLFAGIAPSPLQSAFRPSVNPAFGGDNAAHEKLHVFRLERHLPLS